jgi:L-lactate dehydrogenase (cytochrome)
MTHTVQPNIPETTPAPDATGTPATGAAARPTPSSAVPSLVPAALKRRIPKYSDLAPLMQFKKPEFSRAAKLKRASTIRELRDMA